MKRGGCRRSLLGQAEAEDVVDEEASLAERVAWAVVVAKIRSAVRDAQAVALLIDLKALHVVVARATSDWARLERRDARIVHVV